MSTVQEIEAAIAKLPREDFFRLHESLQAQFEDDWDAEIEKDIQSGKLDSIAKRALAEHRAGRSTPFPPDAE